MKKTAPVTAGAVKGMEYPECRNLSAASLRVGWPRKGGVRGDCILDTGSG